MSLGLHRVDEPSCSLSLTWIVLAGSTGAGSRRGQSTQSTPGEHCTSGHRTSGHRDSTAGAQGRREGKDMAGGSPGHVLQFSDKSERCHVPFPASLSSEPAVVCLHQFGRMQVPAVTREIVSACQGMISSPGRRGEGLCASAYPLQINLGCYDGCAPGER